MRNKCCSCIVNCGYLRGINAKFSLRREYWEAVFNRVSRDLIKSCSHLVKTPSFFSVLVSQPLVFFFIITFWYSNYPSRHVFQWPLVLKFKNQIKFRPSYTCVTITVFRTRSLVDEMFSFLFHLTRTLSV